MDEEKLEYIKFRERFQLALNLIKDVSKQENIQMSENLLREVSDIAKTLFVRSEISYSSKKA